ncbi:hypothetical protein MP228_002818 [Amoeboaphelidium protococcarum]|nr:hypothetical protein MP228_002818 [Amoeboaphelidium protococcarum]
MLNYNNKQAGQQSSSSKFSFQNVVGQQKQSHLPLGTRQSSSSDIITINDDEEANKHFGRSNAQMPPPPLVPRISTRQQHVSEIPKSVPSNSELFQNASASSSFTGKSQSENLPPSPAQSQLSQHSLIAEPLASFQLENLNESLQLPVVAAASPQSSGQASGKKSKSGDGDLLSQLYSLIKSESKRKDKDLVAKDNELREANRNIDYLRSGNRELMAASVRHAEHLNIWGTIEMNYMQLINSVNHKLAKQESRLDAFQILPVKLQEAHAKYKLLQKGMLHIVIATMHNISLEVDLAQKEFQVSQLKEKCSELNAKLQDSETRLEMTMSNSKDQSEKLRSEQEVVKMSYESTIADLSCEVKELAKTKQELAVQKVVRDTEVETLSMRCQHLESLLAEFQMAFDKLNYNISKDGSNHRDAIAKQLEQMSSFTKSNFELLSQQLAAGQKDGQDGESGNVQQQMSMLQSILAQLQSRSSDSEEQQQVRDQLLALHDALMTVKQQLAVKGNDDSATVKELRDQLNQASTENQKLKQSVEQLQSAVRDQESLKDNSDAVEQQKNEIKGLMDRNMYLVSEIESLKEQIASLQKSGNDITAIKKLSQTSINIKDRPNVSAIESNRGGLFKKPQSSNLTVEEDSVEFSDASVYREVALQKKSKTKKKLIENTAGHAVVAKKSEGLSFANPSPAKVVQNKTKNTYTSTKKRPRFY